MKKAPPQFYCKKDIKNMSINVICTVKKKSKEKDDILPNPTLWEQHTCCVPRWMLDHHHSAFVHIFMARKLSECHNQDSHSWSLETCTVLLEEFLFGGITLCMILFYHNSQDSQGALVIDEQRVEAEKF